MNWSLRIVNILTSTIIKKGIKMIQRSFSLPEELEIARELIGEHRYLVYGGEAKNPSICIVNIMDFEPTVPLMIFGPLPNFGELK